MIPELRSLLAVARHGTFAAAGERIALTQSAVSGHIRRLEEALGFPLFERTGRSARLNAAGLRIVQRAEALVADFDSLAELTTARDEAPLLRVGAIASVQATLVARALVPFQAAHSDCRLHLIPGLSLHLVDKVDAGELDLAIVIRPAFDLPAGLAWEPLVTEDYILLVPIADGSDQEWRVALAAWPFIRYDRASFGGRQVDRFLRQEDASISEWLEADDVQAMVALVERGLGCAIVPETETARPDGGKVRRVSLGRGAPQRRVGIVRPTGTASAVAEAFVRDLVAGAST